MPASHPPPDLHLPSSSSYQSNQRDSTASDSSSATDASFHHQDHRSSTSSSRSRPVSNSTMASSRPSSVASNASGCSSPRLKPIERNQSGGLSVSPALLSPGLARSLSPSGSSNAAPRHPSMGPSRRPSMPIVPSMTHRVSTVSVASFESLPEGETVHDFNSLGQGSIDRVSSPASYHSGGTFPADTASLQHPAGPVRSNSHGAAFQRASGGVSPRRSLQRSSTDPPPAPSPSYDMLMKKRLHIVSELLDTEKAYVASLKVLNESYYQPLLAASSKTPSPTTIPAPALSRKALGEIFSNFIDIYHLNIELLACLSDRLSGRSRVSPASRPSSIATTEPDAVVDALRHIEGDVQPWDPERDLVGDLLLPIAPFLKMYSLYVKNFSSALVRTEAERKSNDAFARFLRDTEKATWGKGAQGFGYGLGFQAHLLTLVQRIPRYKMLVGDLLRATPENHADHEDLKQAYAVIEQVASYINENIRQHEMVMTMLSIQRSLTGMSEPLVVPGRSLLKRGTLLKARRRDIQPRVFFLFSDCIIYASPVSGGIDSAAAAFQALTRGAVGAGSNSFDAPPSPNSPRSDGSATSSPYGANGRRRTSSTTALDGPPSFDATGRWTGQNQQLQFRARFNLQDCTVVGVEDHKAAAASSALLSGGGGGSSLRHCFEIRTPDKSFAVYAARAAEREAWLEAIRSAREEHMTARRTLQTEEDSIEAKRHRRRSQHRLYPGGALSGRTIEEGGDGDADSRSGNRADEKGFRRISLPVTPSGHSLSFASLLSSSSSERSASVPGLSVVPAPLRILEDYHAPVWVPDSRADTCSSCSEPFGLWRRRHHCRLCGQVVCWACSTRTFLIASYEDGEEDKPARACDGCYDSVFPEEDKTESSAAVPTPSTEARSSLPTPDAPHVRSEPRPSLPNLSIGAHVVEPRPKRGSVRFGPDTDDDLAGGSSSPSRPGTPERYRSSASPHLSPRPRQSALRRQSRDVSPKSPRLRLPPLATADGSRTSMDGDDDDVDRSPISPILKADGRDPLGRLQGLGSRSVDQLGMGRPTSSSGLGGGRRWTPGALNGSALNLLSSSPSFAQSSFGGSGLGGGPPNLLRSSGAGTKLSDSSPFTFNGGAGALTPHAIQAATSGSGTFRLVTPRLTTPERETPPVLGAVNGGGGAWNERRAGGKTDLSYFTFQDPALQADGKVMHADADVQQPIPQSVVQPRRKPLSAAARLSTFYGAGLTQGK